MPWSSAFYFGSAGETVLVPIETITFAATDAAGFAALEQPSVFETGDSNPAFNFTGEPVFHPLTDGADFNVEC